MGAGGRGGEEREPRWVSVTSAATSFEQVEMDTNVSASYLLANILRFLDLSG